MWVHQNIVRVMILIRSLITILSPQRSSLRWTRNEFNLLRPSIFQQTQIYSLKRVNKHRLIESANSSNLKYTPSHQPKIEAIPRSFEDSNNNVCPPLPPHTCWWWPLSAPWSPCSPGAPCGQWPGCPVCPAVPESALCEAAGPSLVRARQGSPAELCSFLSGRACKHDRPAHTALRLADTASQSQSSAPSDHIQHHIVNINSSAPSPQQQQLW